MNRKVWTIVTLAALLLLIVTACQSNSPSPATEAVPETQTAAQSPTATPVPPTATPEPTTIPTTAATPEAVTIAYMEPDTDKSPSEFEQWLRIYQPEGVSAPYPTIFILPGKGYQTRALNGLAEEFVARGYAVALVKYRTANSTEPYRAPGGEDVLCAFAWLMDNTTAYELDPQRIFVFGHTAGGMAAVEMPLRDEATWREKLVDCPYPVPNPTIIKGVVAYDALLGIPEGTLGKYWSIYGIAWGIPKSDMLAATDTLSSITPQEWQKGELLDENTRKVAEMLPLYWVHNASVEGRATPPYLLIYDSDKKDGFDWVTESETMAENMRTAGIDVKLQLLSNASYLNLLNTETNVPARVAEMADAFMSEMAK